MILRVLTYNIRHGLGSDNVQDLARIRDVLRDSKADVLFLQEVDRGLPRTAQSEQARWLANELGFYFTYDDNYHVGPFKGMGNAILARYELHSTWNKHMPSTKERRGLIHAEIAVESVTISLFATHWGLDETQRDGQGRFCAAEVGVTTTPVIFCGDLNAPPNSSEVKRLSEVGGLTDTWPDSPATYPVENPSARIDYIFTRGNWEVANRERIKTIASDHFPVVIDLGFEA